MTETTDPLASRRKALKVAVSALCWERGFIQAENDALETLTEMLQSYLTEIGRSARSFSELACRTEPMLSDVVMALVEMGMDVSSLPAYARRPNNMVFMPPVPCPPTPTPQILQVGERQHHLSHIPDHLPAFPDPHTYIKSMTHKKPETEYQLIRQRAASQKRDVERALTRFIAKTGETESLFEDDPYAFPLIACKPKIQPYIDALIPKDQDLENDEEMKNSKDVQSAPAKEGTSKRPEKDQKPTLETQQSQSQDVDVCGPDVLDSDSQIDNPYLRAIKMPKLKGGKKSRH